MEILMEKSKLNLIGLPFTCPFRTDTTPNNVGKDYWTDDYRCSHCGSLSPDVAIQLIEQGSIITPTDKGYKCYIEMQVVYFYHFKPQHIERFVKLLKSGDVKFAAPGYFYIPPYFLEV